MNGGGGGDGDGDGAGGGGGGDGGGGHVTHVSSAANISPRKIKNA